MIDIIDVYSTASAFMEEEVRDETVVVIDVLRACSSIQTALENGATGVIPLSEQEDIGKYTRNLDATGFLLCGESDGKKMAGFHLGNSPLEYTRDKVENKTLIFKSTNGTRAITRCNNSNELLIGSFLNITALVNHIKSSNLSKITLICSGWKNKLSIEDLLCAGAISYHLYDKKLPENAMDGAKVAFGLYEKFATKINRLISSSNHASRLRNLGYEEDINYCSEIDRFSSIPAMRDGMITIK